MSQVIPIPVAAIAGLTALLTATQLGASEPVAAAVAVGVGVVVLFGWASSDRLPNGGGPM
jgi:hypothetical protein